MNYNKNSFLAGLSVGRTLSGISAISGAAGSGFPIYYVLYQYSTTSPYYLPSDILAAVADNVQSGTPFGIVTANASDMFYRPGKFFVFVPPFTASIGSPSTGENEIISNILQDENRNLHFIVINTVTGEFKLYAWDGSVSIPASMQSGNKNYSAYNAAKYYAGKRSFILAERTNSAYLTSTALCLYKAVASGGSTLDTFVGATPYGETITLTLDTSDDSIICTF